MRSSISVALCTYNGARYLEAQLGSIAAQSCPPAEVVICDDGSRDPTLELAATFASSAPFPVTILETDSRLGVKANFSRAIQACSGEFIALADQDDIWFADRLKAFLHAIEERGRDVPRLYFSDLRLIDAQGKPIGESLFERIEGEAVSGPYWKSLLLANFIPGCTTVFDSRLSSFLLPLPPQAIIHDWWINLLFSLAGNLVRVPGQLMDYRLHDSNTQGLSSVSKTISTGMERGFLDTAANNYAVSMRQARFARSRLRSAGINYPQDLDEILALENKLPLSRPWHLIRHGVYRRSALKTLQSLMASTMAPRLEPDDFTVVYR